jgi:YjbE family integral membrane protein
MTFTDPDMLGKLGQIVLADILLAGDNALIIALATRALPPKQQFWGRMIGSGGAVLLRVIFVVVIGYLLKVPYLQLAGGVLLLMIAAKLVRPQKEALHDAAHPEEAQGHTRAAGTLREAISVIIIADITMSLDNVVAIANIAKGPTGEMHVPLVVFGLLLSIPLVVWGSSLIARLMEKFRWIVWIGGAVLGHVAGSIIFHDRQVLGWMGVGFSPGGTDAEFAKALSGAAPWIGHTIHVVPWVLAAVLFVYGWWCNRVKSEEGSAESRYQAPKA